MTTKKRTKKPGGELTKSRPKAFVVRGEVRDADGSLLAGAIVRAFDKDLRSEQLLGETSTDKDGHYEVTYTAKAFQRAEKTSADLIVRVFSRKGQGRAARGAPAELVSSKITFNAKPVETVDLVLGGGEYRGPSEYERLVTELTPVLQGISLADLREDKDDQDFTFLSGETSQNRRHIGLLSLAARLSKQTADLKNKMEPEVLYGLLRQNLPTKLTALLSQHRKVLAGALAASLRDNIISLKWSGKTESESIRTTLNQLKIEKAMESGEDGKLSLGKLLAESSLPEGKHREFLKLYFDQDRRMEKFLEELKRDDFKDHVADLKLTFDLGALTQDHLGMVHELKRRGTKSLRDLADLDEAGWTKLITKKVNGKPIGFPPDTPGEEDEKVSKYARSLAQAIEVAYPTSVFAARFKQKGIPGTENIKADLDAFFVNNPDFDFRTTFIEKYFADSTSLNELPHRDVLKGHLKKAQRIFKLTPRFEYARVLLGGGIHSARQIAYMGRGPFVEMYGQVLGGGPRDAEVLWRLAERRAVRIMHMEMRHGWQNNQPQLALVPPPPTQVEGILNWSELFGSLSYCECEHCRSVYSPAAYLVDLLHFIIDQMTLLDRELAPTPARAVLFARRPDIEAIELSCKNTNMPVPYIDLVNELLENAIAPGQHDDRWPQTDWTAEELSVNPEHLNQAAYIPLRDDAIYPLSLPWDSSIEEVRLWLRHLGVERHELMRVFQQAPGGGEESSPTEIEIATEHLGLTTKAREIITGVELHDTWEYWGLQEDDNPVPSLEDPGETVQVNWFEALRRVPMFMQRSGLSYEQLQELLDLMFINKEINDQPRIRIDHPVSCNLDASRIDRLTGDDLRKIPRFLRLWRGLGWTMREMDQTLTALGVDDLDELNNDLLLDLSLIQRLRAELDLPLDTLLTWWGNIDTRRYVDRTKSGQPIIPSLYERLFRNPAVLNPLPDPPFIADPQALAGELSSQAAAICAALAISADDFSLLTSSPLVLPIDADNAVARLDLNNLSALYRHVTLARALRLSVLDYLSLRALISTDPFGAPNGALQFIEQAGRIRASAFSIGELNYLLRHAFDPTSGIAPAEDGMTLLLAEIRDGLQKVNNERAIGPDENQEALRLRQESLIRERVATAFGLESAVAESLLETVLERRGDAASVMDNFLRLTSAEGLSAVYYDTSNLAGSEVHRTDPQIDFDWGIQSPAEGIPADAFSARWSGKILGQHSETHTFYVRCDDGCRLWIDGKLLIDEWHDQEAAEHSASTPLTAGQFYDITLEYYENGVHAVAELSWSSASTLKEIIPEARLYPRERQEEARELLVVLHKVTLMINRFKMTARDVAYVAEHEDRFDGFDFNALPLAPAGSPAPPFASWERLVEFFQLRNLLPGGVDTLNAAVELANADSGALLDALSQRTAWNRDDLAFQIEQDALRLRYPQDFQNGHALSRLHACFGLIKRLRVSAQQCHEWTEPVLSQTEANAARHAVKSKYDQERWLGVARPVQDILREKRRTALVAYLTSHPVGERLPFEDANALFNHFLIDVEMSACMVTSRIKQAIGSVQLFIQRCLMNLEPEGYPDPNEDWAVFWGWMKNYRVWEANRKVFLWPENWIEPELRDDKSPFFKDLENELLQNEVTADNTETAFRNYLEKLDQVARLEICGMYHQVEDGMDILHVFGRTGPGEPHIYYYRQLVDAAYWTPWESVDLDIQDDHLIPVVWNRRLYLFWPIFTEKAEEADPPEEDAEPEEKMPKKYWEIQMAWSEYKNGKWSAKKVTAAESAVPFDHLNDKSKFSFKTIIVGGNVELYCMDNTTEVAEIFQFSPGFKFFGCGGRYNVFGPRAVPLDWGPGSTTVASMGFIEMGDLSLTLNEFVINRDTGMIESFRPTTILNSTPGTFSVVSTHQKWLNFFDTPFFYQDDVRTFFVTKPTLVGEVLGDGGLEYQFQAFHHPYVCDFIEHLNRYGIEGLLRWSMQDPVLQLNEREFFDDDYDPEDAVVLHPLDDVDVELGGAYSLYNWELFFHAPLLIADRLSKNQRFEEAQRWYHYIFDPTDRSDKPPLQRYWKFKKFYNDAANPIQTLEELLSDEETLTGEVDQWRKHPFNPHMIARTRIGAYQKTVVMKYLDNLIAWGDQLFRRETIESINEAFLLYVLAAEVLGPRAVKIPAQMVEPRTYSQAREGRFDALSNFEAENVFVFDDLPRGVGAPDVQPPDGLPGGDVQFGEPAHAHVVTTWYFCIPPNDKLLSYWETVADRLFKIRHCMTIEGVVRQLPLFEPPIEPGLLVRAAAMGVDISSALNDINAELPHYRFNVMVQKATELCNDVKSLGVSLLSILEKQDAEELALLRSRHELNLLEKIRQIKEKQIEEAKESLEGLNRAKIVTETRRDYYRDIEEINRNERLNMDKLGIAHDWQNVAQLINLAATAAHLVPDFTAGLSGWLGSPVAVAKYGGSNVGTSLQAFSGVASYIAGLNTYDANMASIRGGYDRRWNDWKLQEQLANKELEQTERQIAAADIRLAIATKELENHDSQIENAKATDEFMRSKYTNQELYQWQVGQISGVYFQSYRLAYDLAKRAERCFRFELGLEDSSYINFGYWDSLKKGLLSGEKLQYDLRRLETAYLEQNRREFELTKHISLVLLDPLALVTLRETGRCSFKLPEEIFDLDYPGHYFRRIKSVSLTLPCVVGPYTTISCTLRLVKNSIRINTTDGNNGYPRNTDADDSRFIENNIPVKAIAASNAQNDSGVFELSFRDERYLPFEGAGAVSDWSLELFSDLPSNNPDQANPDFGKPLRQFDYGTISDAILHVKYTAREGASAFKNLAVAHLREYFSQAGTTPSMRLFNLRNEFPTQWHRFLNPTNPEDGNVFELEMSPTLFPLRDFGKTLNVNTIWLLARCTRAESYNVVMTPPLPAPPPPDSNTITLTRDPQYGGLHLGQKGGEGAAPLGIEIVPSDPPVWRIKVTRGDANLIEDPVKKVMEVEDVMLVLGYEWE